MADVEADGREFEPDGHGIGGIRSVGGSVGFAAVAHHRDADDDGECDDGCDDDGDPLVESAGFRRFDARIERRVGARRIGLRFGCAGFAVRT